jgi:multiple antibiotic resistance protein
MPILDFTSVIGALYATGAGIVTLFVILDPIGVLPFFHALTTSATPEQRKKIAKRSVKIAMALLLIFAYLGNVILLLLGITLYDFQVAGGVLLLVFALRDALSNEPLGASEASVASSSSLVATLDRIAVIPLATPLLAGPGSLTTVILLANSNPATHLGLLIAGVAIVVDCALAWVALTRSEKLNKIIGPSGLMIIGKVMDILMAAIAVSYLVRGVTGLGL